MKSNTNTININAVSSNFNQLSNTGVYIHLNKIIGAGEPQLVHTGLKLYKRSITPDTFRELKFDKSEKDLLYTEYYKCETNKGNGVARFAINYSNIKADLEEGKILGEYKSLIDTTKKVEKSVKSSQYKLEDAGKIVHHGLEKDLVKQAINQLLTSDEKTVLIDIFARDNGAIKILEGAVPETHTVVLYKNPQSIDKKHEILVIDPSNFLFSSHLSNLNETLKHDLLSKITTIHKGLQIYRPDSENVGSDNSQYRDCIDIAVKIAFGLNKVNEYYKDTKDIMSSDIIKFISNSSDINKSLPDYIYDKQFVKLPLRIQQKSNIKIEKDFYDFSKIIKENLINVFGSEQKEKFANCYESALFSSDKSPYADTLKELWSLGKATFSQIHQELNTKEQKILGEDFSSNIYD